MPEKELKTVCSKEIKPPATINFFPFFSFCAACVSCRPQKSMVVFVVVIVIIIIFFLFGSSCELKLLLLFFMFSNPFCRVHKEFVHFVAVD